MLQLHIRLFGAPRILQDDVPLAISRNQVRALLLRLAADLQPAARGSLCLLFWPDVPEKRARHHLSQLLSLLRSSLPDPEILQATPDHVALNPKYVWSDSAKFAALSKQQSPSPEQCRLAIDLYGGPFLEGFCLPDCPEYEHWQLHERNRHEQRYLQALSTLLADATARGAYSDAIHCAERYLAVDELAEEVQRRLVVLRGSTGSAHAALLQCEDSVKTPVCEPDSPRAPKLRNTGSTTRRSDLHNLPIPPTPMLGRKEEIAAATDYLRGENAWLLTLTGPGGSGKTRLAIEAAFALQPHYAHGVVFVDLAGVRDPALVLPAIERSLQLHAVPGQNSEEGVQAYLRDKCMLLVLDNFEQVVTTAPLLAKVRSGAPDIAFIVTSRVPLRLRGERELPVPSLPVPDEGAIARGSDLLQYDSIRLFVDRVKAACPNFVLTQEGAAAVAAICRRLDGQPLPIELAAVRCRVLSPQALLARLDAPLDLLKAGACDLPERQKTLRTTIAWSIALLPDDAQALFRRLGVLAGEFRLTSAEAVCVGQPDLGIDALDGLAVLVEHNLLRHVLIEGDDEPHYVMLETIRSYAIEQLKASGEYETVRRRQEAYLLRLVEHAEVGLRGPQQVLWLKRLKQEHANLVSVLEHTLKHPQTHTAVRLAGGLWWYWFLSGRWNEGRRWLDCILGEASEGISPAARAKAACGAGVLALFQGDHLEAHKQLNESLTIFRAIDDPPGQAYVLIFLGLLMLWRGNRPLSVAYLEHCAAIMRALADRWGLALALSALGVSSSNRSLLDESWSLWRELGDRWGIAEALSAKGYFAMSRQDYVQSEFFYAQSLQHYRAVGDKRGMALVCHKLGEIFQRQGKFDRAKTYYAESLTLFRELGHKRDTAWCLYRLGEVAGAQGDDRLAHDLLAEGLYLFEQLDLKRDLASVFQDLAHTAGAQGHPARAAELLSVASTLQHCIAAPATPAEQAEQNRFAATLQDALGAENFDAAWSQGRRRTLLAAIECALCTR